jgi:probable HAF family extracellular repeat protein
MPAYSYANIDYPFGFYTNAQAINDIGQIAGFFYYEDGGFAHGFLYSGGTYTTIDDPLAVGSTTAPVDINASGQIIGRYSDSSYVTNGFLYSGGIYTTIDDPFSTTGTFPESINDTGQIAGWYGDSSGFAHGFLYSGGTYTAIDYPFATTTFPTGINASGQITGQYRVGSEAHSFLYSGGTYTTIDDPLGVATYAQAINDTGQIAGWYADSSGLAHGFLYSGGTYTTIDDPLATPDGGTYTFDINASGQLIGFYQDGSGISHALLATPIPNPVMSDAKADHKLTTLNGTAEANSNVSIFDGTHLLGTVASASDGTWSLQTKLGHGIHDFTETSTDLAGNTVSSSGVTLYASNAHQVLQGGSGNDVLIGHRKDMLTGGAGADTFVFNPKLGKETITDFNAGQDVLSFDHTLFAEATASQVLSQMHDGKAGAVIVIDHADTITLTGVHVADLQSHLSDFDFF